MYANHFKMLIKVANTISPEGCDVKVNKLG